MMMEQEDVAEAIGQAPFSSPFATLSNRRGGANSSSIGGGFGITASPFGSMNIGHQSCSKQQQQQLTASRHYRHGEKARRLLRNGAVNALWEDQDWSFDPQNGIIPLASNGANAFQITNYCTVIPTQILEDLDREKANLNGEIVFIDKKVGLSLWAQNHRIRQVMEPTARWLRTNNPQWEIFTTNQCKKNGNNVVRRISARLAKAIGYGVFFAKTMLVVATKGRQAVGILLRQLLKGVKKHKKAYSGLGAILRFINSRNFELLGGRGRASSAPLSGPNSILQQQQQHTKKKASIELAIAYGKNNESTMHRCNILRRGSRGGGASNDNSTLLPSSFVDVPLSPGSGFSAHTFKNVSRVKVDGHWCAVADIKTNHESGIARILLRNTINTTIRNTSTSFGENTKRKGLSDASAWVNSPVASAPTAKIRMHTPNDCANMKTTSYKKHKRVPMASIVANDDNTGNRRNNKVLFRHSF
eukprot:jgi/Bigna1/84356/fgenesh1_pg.131_\